MFRDGGAIVGRHGDQIRIGIELRQHNRHKSTVENFEIGIDRCIVRFVDFSQLSIPNRVASFKRSFEPAIRRFVLVGLPFRFDDLYERTFSPARKVSLLQRRADPIRADA